MSAIGIIGKVVNAHIRRKIRQAVAALVEAHRARAFWKMGKQAVPEPQVGAERVGEHEDRTSGRAGVGIVQRAPGQIQDFHDASAICIIFHITI